MLVCRTLYPILGLIVVLGLASPAYADPKELSEIKVKMHEKGAKWEAQETAVSLLPKEERLKRLGLNKHALSVEAPKTLSAVPSTGTLPATLDYRATYVTPVKNQGSCGSCWAFATTAALESQVLMTGGTVKDDSEQTMVSCGGAGSCSGGYIDKASSYNQSTGLPVETCYPYTATNGTCASACANWQAGSDKISNWQWVTTSSANVDAIKNALANYGPLVTTMDVYADFFYYKGGVYSYTSGAYQGGHAIELVGYDDAAGAFIAKNSWGTGWGEAGFFRIAYNQALNSVSFGAWTIAYNTGSVPTCSYSLSPASVSVAATGGAGAVQVTTQDACAVTSLSNDAWITVSGGASFSGSGAVSYSVEANGAASSRTGTITIGGKNFTVTQASPVSIMPTSVSAPASGGTGSVQVTAPDGVAWTASSSVSWIAVSAGASGSGNGTVGYTVAANKLKKARTGTLTIGGQKVTVTQAKYTR